ncbi:MAG TPA: 4'-phosphopantetheinyl transferase superfamily protein [Pseudonocardia sp.]
MSTCHVWWAAPVAPADAPALVELLDEHERERLSRFRQPADSARYLAAHALTRIVLGRFLERAPSSLVIDRTCRCGAQHGKPTLAGGGPGFSLSHAGDVVGVAVLDGGVLGLDVEAVRPMSDLAAMADHVGAPAEPSAFFQAWTRKEALLKATGDGLTSPMEAIVLDADGVRSWTGEGAPDGPVWLRDLRAPDGSPAAVAGLGPKAPEVIEHDGAILLHEGESRSSTR